MNGRRGIALAVARGTAPPRLIDPAGGWSRPAILAWLRRLALRRTDMLVGLDLSPSLPFVDCGAYLPGWDQSPGTLPGLWRLVDRISARDRWLGVNSFVDHPDVAPHFRRAGGREGARFGGGVGRLRVVERRQRATGQANSASVFNLVGAAQVGKGSLAAMRLFHRLGGAIPFWPFDPVPEAGPCLVEIYTSIAARAAGVPRGRSKVRDAEALAAAFSALGSRGNPSIRHDDHATDALITAAWLRRVAAQSGLWHPETLTPDIASREGWTFGVV